MRKLVYNIVFVTFCVLISGCSKDPVPVNQAPSVVNAIFPENNQLCISNVITFNWTNAIDPEDEDIEYEIIVARDRGLTNVIENRTQAATQLGVTLEKGEAYYWQITAIDENDNRGESTPVFAFFTKGESVVNYAPFAAELVSPANNGAVSSGSINLSWNGNDVDANDTLTYELFFGEGGNLSLIDDDLSTTNFSVDVTSGRSYSWRVNVKDQHGAKSIGQIWEFTAN